jgi:IclR family acetate operon transcriptional repressor
MLQYTPHTITEQEQLSVQLEEIRRNGYAVEDGEYKVGLRSVSAPVFDTAGEIRYALTTIGFFRRVRSVDFENAIQATARQAKMLSAALGYAE